MLNPKCNITTYNSDGKEVFIFPFCHSFEIKSSRNTYSDTATIVLPQKMSNKTQKISDLINVGDRITVEAGYKNMTTIFDGYVKSIDPNSPMKLECEDEAFIYKIQSLPENTNKQYKNITFNGLLSEIYKGQYKSTDDLIGTITIDNNAGLLDVLDYLKNTFYVDVYWQKNTLYVGYELFKEPEKTIILDIQGNVPIGTDNVIKLKQNDLLTVAYGLSPQKDGSKIELYAYYKDVQNNEIVYTTKKPIGNINKLEVPEQSEADLKKLLKRWLPKLYYSGLSGDITTFGAPDVNHGDEAKIIDRRIPDRNGIYEIIEVVKTFSVTDGYKQKITLGLKLRDE